MLKCCLPLYLLASLVCGYTTGAPHFLGGWAALMGDQTPSINIKHTHTKKKKWILLSCFYLKRVKWTIKSGCSPRRASCCSSARPPCVNKSSEADYKVATGGSHGAIYSGGVAQPTDQTWKQVGHTDEPLSRVWRTHTDKTQNPSMNDPVDRSNVQSN